MSKVLMLGAAAGAAVFSQPFSEPRPTFRLRFLGDPILKTRAAHVGSPADIPRSLLAEMEALVQRERALGLAAPQMGVPLRIAMARWNGELHTLINPMIVARSKMMEHVTEGCLSIADFTTSVLRHTSVTVRYFTPEWKEYQAQCSLLQAPSVQHEIDHLDGILITDGVTRQQRRQAERLVAKVRS